MNAPVAALRSLAIGFQRKGIVADTAAQLDPKVRVLVDNLRAQVREIGRDSRANGQRDATSSAVHSKELFSKIQLWKERSLYQTLKCIDTVGSGSTANPNALQESHIETIELHEQAAKELYELVLDVLNRVAESLNYQLEEFGARLAEVLTELIKPELEDQLEHERVLVRQLVEQKQQLDRDKEELEHSCQHLEARIEALESAPEGGGDALLCNKLRVRVRDLASTERELRSHVEELTFERDQCRWKMTSVQEELEQMRNTLTLTCAMHEKETKQLMALAHSNYEQVTRVMAASRADPMGPVKSYDAHSGRSIVHLNNGTSVNGRSPSSPTKARLVCYNSALPLRSPNQKARQVSDPPSCVDRPRSPRVDAANAAPSPRGAVVRPFASTSAPSHER